MDTYSRLWFYSGLESCCQNLISTIISTRAKMMAPPGKPLRGLGKRKVCKGDFPAYLLDCVLENCLWAEADGF